MINNQLNRFFAFAVFFMMLSISINIKAQNINYYTDQLGFFKVFDNGEIHQIEHLPVQRIVMGGNYLFYQDSQENLIYYFNGKKERVTLNYPDLLTPARNFAITNLGGGINVFYEQDLTNLILANQVPDLEYGDSIIAYINYDGYLNAFVMGEKYEIEGPFEGRLTQNANYKVSNNSLAYIDLANRLQLWYDDEKTEIEDIVSNFWVGNNLVAFVDEYDDFVVYDKTDFITLEEYPPNRVMVSNNFVAYIDDDDHFNIYYDGEVEEITTTPVNIVTFKDDVIVWLDEVGFLYYWQDGKSELLENVTPNDIKVDFNNIVYTDYDNRLKGVYKGKKVNYTDEIVELFELNGNVLRYQFNQNEIYFYWNGETY